MWTKEERAAYDKAYYEANKKKVRDYQKGWYEANKEKKRAYREAHKEEIVAKAKVYYEDNREKRMAYDKAYREAHKEERSTYDKAYYEDNIEKIRDKNLTTNAERMTVNGKYISRKHPLWKIGKYKSFNDAAFSSFVNYSKSTDGYVYAIKNKAWPEWVKVGKAGDAEDRLKGYQTGDPFRDYTLEFSFKVPNRHKAETEAHKALSLLSEDRRNEWFKVDLTTAVRCIEAINE